MVSGPYIQHNPLFPNGLDAIVEDIKQVGRIPCEVKRVAIDGDMAFVHVRYLDWGGQETAGVDIFRFDSDGKVVKNGTSATGTSLLEQREHDVLGACSVAYRRPLVCGHSSTRRPYFARLIEVPFLSTHQAD